MSRCSYVIAAFLLFGLLCEHMVSSGAQIQQDKICGKEVSWAVFKMGNDFYCTTVLANLVH